MKTGDTLEPTDLRDFLKSLGWSVIEEALRDRLYAFQSPRFERRGLIFPMDSDAPDYAESVGNVLAKLAEMTGQTPATLRARAQSARDDVVRMRVYSYGDDSALPLSFAASLVQNAAKVLKSTACTVLRPRVHHPKLSLSDATALVDAARFGHTEEGSFILRVACPLDSVQGNPGPDGAEGPFVRQVTLSMQRALARLTSAIEADRLDTLVDELKASPAPMLASNLCEAIAGMHDEVLGNSLDVSVDWSTLHPIGDAALRRPVRIQRDYFARIEEVHQELRSVARYEEGPFFGTVEALNGTMGDDGRRSGEVILSLLLPEEGEMVRAKVVLPAEEYSKADRAHMTNKALVRVSGRLLPGRQPRWMTNASNFEIVTT
jgi:hypothetical protein